MVSLLVEGGVILAEEAGLGGIIAEELAEAGVDLTGFTETVQTAKRAMRVTSALADIGKGVQVLSKDNSSNSKSSKHSHHRGKRLRGKHPREKLRYAIQNKHPIRDKYTGKSGDEYHMPRKVNVKEMYDYVNPDMDAYKPRVQRRRRDFERSPLVMAKGALEKKAYLGFPELIPGGDAVHPITNRYDEMTQILTTGETPQHGLANLPNPVLPDTTALYGTYFNNANVPKLSDGTPDPPYPCSMGTTPAHVSMHQGGVGPSSFGSNQPGTSNPPHTGHSDANIMFM